MKYVLHTFPYVVRGAGGFRGVACRAYRAGGGLETSGFGCRADIAVGYVVDQLDAFRRDREDLEPLEFELRNFPDEEASVREAPVAKGVTVFAGEVPPERTGDLPAGTRLAAVMADGAIRDLWVENSKAGPVLVGGLPAGGVPWLIEKRERLFTSGKGSVERFTVVVAGLSPDGYQTTERLVFNALAVPPSVSPSVYPWKDCRPGRYACHMEGREPMEMEVLDGEGDFQGQLMYRWFPDTMPARLARDLPVGAVLRRIGASLRTMEQLEEFVDSHYLREDATGEFYHLRFREGPDGPLTLENAEGEVGVVEKITARKGARNMVVELELAGGEGLQSFSALSEVGDGPFFHYRLPLPAAEEEKR